MKANHRVLFGALASIVALAACNGGGSVPSAGGPNAASNLLRSNQNRVRPDAKDLCANYKLKLVNKTHRQVADKDVYFLLAGRAGPEHDAKFIYLADANGKTEVAKSGTDVKTFNLATTSEFTIPLMRAARFYVSYNAALKLPVDDKGHIIYPNAADMRDSTPWDFLEWNKYTNCNNLTEVAFAPNLSQVDAFTIPMQFHIEGLSSNGESDAEETRGFPPGAYNTILQQIQGNPDFRGLALSNGSGRILSPVKGLDAKVISDSYYAPYIGKVWKNYETAKLQMSFNLTCNGLSIRTKWLEGQVKNSQLVFTQTPGQCRQLDPIAFSMPTTKDVFFGLIQTKCVSGCTGKDGAQENTVSQIAAALNAAFYRSTLLKTTTISNETTRDSTYCKQEDAVFYDADITNFYGKYVHAQALDHLGYLSSVDEVCAQSSLVSFNVPGLKGVTPDATPFTVTLEER